jgi:hypothetical protein
MFGTETAFYASYGREIIMARRNRVFGLLLILVLLLSVACEQSGQPTPTPMEKGPIETSAAQTVVAGLTQAAGPDAYYTQAAQTIEAQQGTAAPSATVAEAATEPPMAAPTDTPTHTLLPPTDTVTPEPTASPTVTLSPTPTIPMITATEATNCRKGPSKVFDIDATLYPEDSVQVFGKDPTGYWWYIQNPDWPTAKCWVWTETTVVTGDTSSLPIVQPPPTPTPSMTPVPGFNAYFSNVHLCGVAFTAVFQIDNTGGWNLESLNLQIDDLTNPMTLYGPSSSDAPFMGGSGECPPGGNTLKVGKTGYIGGAMIGAISGHQARATITICTEDGLGGLCIQKTVDFVIP